MRLIVAALFGPFLAVGLVGLAADGHLVSWVAGAVFGVGTGVAIAMRESPPAYIENWQLGAEGERKTEKALRPLDPSRWFVVHDVEHGHGNYDHIAVGRAGVFLLDTKNLQGVVHMRGGEPHLRRRSDPEADGSCAWIRSAALGCAASLSEEIQRRTGHRRWVQAVVVLWSDFEESVFYDEKCVLVHGSRVYEWISGRPDALDQTTTDELVDAIQAIVAEGRADESGEPHAAGRPVDKQVSESARPAQTGG